MGLWGGVGDWVGDGNWVGCPEMQPYFLQKKLRNTFIGKNIDFLFRIFQMMSRILFKGGSGITAVFKARHFYFTMF